MALDTYAPSNWTHLNASNPMTGFADIVAGAEAEGFRVYIDFEDYREWVSPETAALAAHEMGESRFGFVRDGKIWASMLTIPENNAPGEWLCDYTSVDWLNDLVEKHVPTE